MATHAAYNGGRLVSYLFLGVVAGLVGMGANSAGALVGVSRTAAVLSGTLMILWGGSTLLAMRGMYVPRLAAPSALRSSLGAVLARLRNHSPVARAGATGLLTTLLPCGWLYAFVVAASGTGSVPHALLIMAAFWVGTVPAMVAVGVGVQRLAGPLRRRLPVLTAVVVVVIGVLSIAGRLQVDVRALASRPGISRSASPTVPMHDRH